MENLTAADVAAVTRPNYMGMGGYGGFGGGWEGLLGLAAIGLIFGGFGGGGFGGFGGGNGISAIYGAQQFNQLDNAIRNTQNGISDATYALNNGINGVVREVLENKFAAQKCCCETQRAIDGVNYNNSKNTCDIINAIHSEGEATRGLITQNQIQELRDKLADKDRDVLARDFQLSQLSQNATLINALQPTAKPAYIVANPNCCQNVCGCGLNYGAFA